MIAGWAARTLHAMRFFWLAKLILREHDVIPPSANIVRDGPET
jgi:hypothetical protein